MTTVADSSGQHKIHCCISHRFSTIASQNLNKVVVIHASAADDAPPSVQSVYDCDRFFKYAELISAVDFLTSQLRHLKTNSELRPRIFGIYMAPSVEYIFSVLSVLRCSEAFLPLDPSWPKQRLLSVVASANVDVIITSTMSFGYELESSWLEKTSDRRLLWFSMEDVESMTVSDGGECDCEKERLFCYVMYTSGSMGKPKGVCGTEKGLWNRFRWMQELYPAIEKRGGFVVQDCSELC